MKRKVKLTESQLHNIIKESVKQVLNENWETDFNAAIDKRDYIQSKNEYNSKSWFNRILAMIRGNKPKDPNTEATLEQLLNKYVESFNKEHNIGKRTDYNDGSSFHSTMKYDNKDGYPVLSATHYDSNSGTVAQTRKKFNSNGREEEWGIKYPYSEIGYTMKDLPKNANDDSKRQYDNFNRNREEITNVINRRNNKNRQ